MKFKITPERVAEACGYIEYFNLGMGDLQTVLRVAPRFVVDEAGNYLVNVIHDEDGGVDKLEFYDKALLEMAQTTPKSLEKLIPQFREAAQGIVNPPKGEG